MGCNSSKTSKKRTSKNKNGHLHPYLVYFLTIKVPLEEIKHKKIVHKIFNQYLPKQTAQLSINNTYAQNKQILNLLSSLSKNRKLKQIKIPELNSVIDIPQNLSQPEIDESFRKKNYEIIQQFNNNKDVKHSNISRESYEEFNKKMPKKVIVYIEQEAWTCSSAYRTAGGKYFTRSFHGGYKAKLNHIFYSTYGDQQNDLIPMHTNRIYYIVEPQCAVYDRCSCASNIGVYNNMINQQFIKHEYLRLAIESF